nr:LOW QUALITY PROTEIN: hypothetical protein L203_06679 [Cryptococcus depauperatus CBS 7841]
MVSTFSGALIYFSAGQDGTGYSGRLKGGNAFAFAVNDSERLSVFRSFSSALHGGFDRTIWRLVSQRKTALSIPSFTAPSTIDPSNAKVKKGDVTIWLLGRWPEGV